MISDKAQAEADARFASIAYIETNYACSILASKIRCMQEMIGLKEEQARKEKRTAAAVREMIGEDAGGFWIGGCGCANASS